MGEPEEASFKTVEELLEVPFVKHFTEDRHFHRFSIADEHLMAEYEEGRKWFIVGTIDRPKSVKLPNWIHI